MPQPSSRKECSTFRRLRLISVNAFMGLCIHLSSSRSIPVVPKVWSLDQSTIVTWKLVTNAIISPHPRSTESRNSGSAAVNFQVIWRHTKLYFVYIRYLCVWRYTVHITCIIIFCIIYVSILWH